jgi:hypothetical protein
MRETKCSCVNINEWCGLLHNEITGFSRPLSRRRWQIRFISICRINSLFHSWNNIKLQLPSARWGRAALHQDFPSCSGEGDPWAPQCGWQTLSLTFGTSFKFLMWDHIEVMARLSEFFWRNNSIDFMLRYVTLGVLFNDAVSIEPVIGKLPSMEQLRNENCRVKMKCSQKTLTQCHFVHHKSQTTIIQVKR